MGALIKLTDRFTETAIDDEIVIMRLDTGEIFALSDTAAAVWRLIDGQRDRHGLIGALASDYSADEAVLAEEVDELLASLRQTGILERG